MRQRICSERERERAPRRTEMDAEEPLGDGSGWSRFVLLHNVVVQFVYALILVAVVAPLVAAPLWRRRGTGDRADIRHEELEALKEAKYRALRDTELDHAAGKLSEEDYLHRRATLRSEAAEILARMDLQPPSGPVTHG